MANSRHYLSNQQIEEPRNWEDLEITVDWASDKLDTTISLDKLEFVGQTAIDVIARMQAGLSGGLGMFEGEPYRIEVGDPNNNPFVFNGYLDFTDNPVVKDCNIVEVALNREQGADWLEATALGIWHLIAIMGLVKSLIKTMFQCPILSTMYQMECSF
jgi:hypothetical protein